MVLSSVADQLQALNERVHTFAFDIVFIEIRQQLSQTPKLQVPFSCVFLIELLIERIFSQITWFF